MTPNESHSFLGLADSFHEKLVSQYTNDGIENLIKYYIKLASSPPTPNTLELAEKILKSEDIYLCPEDLILE